MGSVASVPDWSGLVPDLLAEIATKLNFIEDFTAFRGVCTSWRAAASKDRFETVCKLPLLMLSGNAIRSDVREFYSLYKRKIFSRVPVPESNGKVCIGAGFGWIMTAGISNGLVKPMSCSKIQLPTLVSEYSYIYHAVLSANPSETSDFMLMVNVDHSLDFWRNGDSQWTKLEMKTNPNQYPPTYPNFCCYKNKMYVTDIHGNVWMWDPFLPKSPAEIILTIPYVSWLRCDILVDYYLVESSKGELLRIIKRKVYKVKSYSLHFHIVQIDTVKRASRVMEHLDQDAIFIDINSAVSAVAADFPAGMIKANHIYYIDDDQRFSKQGKDMGGIYSVKDKSTEWFDLKSVSSRFSPFWVFPSLN